MPGRTKIERDAMLREFGYDLPTMSSDAKNGAAKHMEKTHGLEHFYLKGKNVKHYYLDQVIQASKPIAA